MTEPRSSGGADLPVVSSAELLRLRERSWSDQLSGVSLVAERLARAEYTEQVLGVLGRFYRRADYSRSSMLRRWPAVQVMATVSAAAEHYHQGTFWPALRDLAGVHGQTFQADWGTAFLANLRALGLPDFSDIEDPGARFVGPILMHAGVPTYCLGDYFTLVTERRGRNPGIRPEDFVAWASSRAVEDRLFNVDKPVARFLRYGGDFAIDVTDRVFELLDSVSAGGDGQDVPLPDRFRSAALGMRQQGTLGPPQRQRVGEAPKRGPELVLDPYGRGPILRLPPVETDPGEQAIWTVTVGTRSERIRTQALWPGDPAPATDVPLVSPVRSVTAALLRRQDLPVTVAVVDDKDPLLVFAEDGGLLPPGLPVPGSIVWVLFPGAVDALATQGDARVVSYGVLPPGWAGWSLVLMDLTAVTTIRGPESQRSRSVRRVAAVRIVTGDPVVGLRSRSGGPVFDAPPVIESPVGETSEATWSVTITDAAGSVLVDGRPITPGSDQSAVWAGVPRPLLGTYRIRVRGPWGRGASREVVVAEGASVESTPPWRRICPNGLVPAMVHVRLSPGAQVDEPQFTLGEAQTERAIMVSSGGGSMSLTVRPPHMTMSYQSTELSTAPAIRPISLLSEDVTESPGVLTVSLEAMGEPVLHVLSGRRCVQELQPLGASRFGIYRFNLAQATDTLTAHPRVRFALDEAGELTVATLTPRRLCSGIDALDGVLHLRDAVDVEGLVAVVYPMRAPWRGGTSVAVHGGIAALPDELCDSGPLQVIVRIEDPWAPAPIPAWPRGRSVIFCVEAAGWLRSEDVVEAELSRYLAGEADFPVEAADLAHVWAIAARLPWIGLDDRFFEVAKACRQALQEDPTSSLLALTACEVEVDRIPEALIRSGLAWPSATLPRRAHVGWTRASVLPAALLTGSRLCSQLGLESDELAEARAVCGDDIEEILRGHDPSPRAGRFDQGADVYAASDRDQRAEFRRNTDLVPEGLLGKDTRVGAALYLLDHAPKASERLRNEAGRAVREVFAFLRAVGDQRGLDAVTARMHPTRDTEWRVYPALSLGLAWMARRAARDEQSSRGWVKAHSRLWADLARVGPELVAIDLVLAELLTAAADMERLKEET